MKIMVPTSRGWQRLWRATSCDVMKKRYSLLILLILTLQGCSEYKKNSATNRQLSNYSLATKLFVQEYGELPSFATPREFLDVISENNRKRIAFYAIFDGELGADGQPVDRFGKPIRIKKNEKQILFHSSGPDGVFTQDRDSDDIMIIYEETHNQSLLDNPIRASKHSITT